MLSSIIIDDERYAREELASLLQESGEIEIMALCTNAIEGMQAINQLKPDVVFLDIHMPQITGLEMLSMLDLANMPKIVFVTAYDEFAVKAFEDNAFDYILKPISPCRLAKTIERLKSSQISTDYSVLSHEQLELIPCSGFQRIIMIKPEDIELAFSDATGVHIISKSNTSAPLKSTSSLSLKILEEKTALIRCHRQYLINCHAIREIKLHDKGSAEIITSSGEIAPVSRRYLKTLKDRFSLS